MKKPTLQQYYEEVVRKKLCEGGRYANVHEVPAIEKIVVNSAISADAEKTWAEEVAREIGLIVGQQPVVIRARKSISNFKLRAGIPNGVKVTLRGRKMYEFLFRLLSVALPRIRDFRGLSTRFDGHGNYTFGLQEHSIFPEINVDRERRAIGMDISFVTTAHTNEEAMELLSLMGVPFVRRATGSAEGRAA
ncbi:MAG: 50S ribosomal protein L5 [Puniceicoccales bacterium]|jgi:large subunit ribosomal protein L5|nr:50S ribosomal protein L5 [Puniceicoccales bacterium]